MRLALVLLLFVLCWGGSTAEAAEQWPRITTFRQFTGIFNEYRSVKSKTRFDADANFNADWAVLGVLFKMGDDQFAAWVVRQRRVSLYLRGRVLPALTAIRRKQGARHAYPKAEALIRQGW